ncbi:ATP-dependent RNA helicase DDX51 [Genypterus blacodes]|uniref:ATP-dependent RNA helicase DDX51 n=1 Tax=Genypterus blacodes TaxID=154954 RepID=UPI003F7745D2
MGEMSLFVVNRYLGEDEDEETSAESKSQALLAKLQQKAKEKQRRSLTVKREEEQIEVKKQKKKKKTDDSPKPKKRKSEATPTELLHDPDADHHDDEAETKKRKKQEEKNKKKKMKTDQSGSSVKSCSDAGGTESNGQMETGGGGEEEEAGAAAVEAEKEQRTQQDSGFTVLGGFENKPVQKVARVLPQWLAQPDVIHRDIRSHLVPVSEVQGLCARLVSKLEQNGIQRFFPVQAEVVPAILDGARQGLLIGRGGYKPRDVCVSAPTGSGKTLAFVIPVIQVLMQRVVCEVRALVVLPTKELAQQVCKVFSSYAEGTSLKVVMLAGQKSFAAEQTSLSELRGGVRRSLADVVVATPGRLVDHINKNPGFCLQHLRFLIIDEADRMIDSMHQSWLSQVTKAVYRAGSGPEAESIFGRTEPTLITAASLSPPQTPLQKLLFSATLTQNPEKLQQLGLHQPRLFSSAHSSADGTTQEGFNFPEGLTEYFVPCTLSKKPLLILHLILRMKFSPVLCFTNSREAAHRLYLLVQLFGGVEAAEFSSRLSPGERKKTLKEFEQGKIKLLISTDAAARGIDINGVKCVVNYDAPQFIRTYIHRIGRTARAGRAGLAFTFLLGVQEKNFLQMVSEAGSPGMKKQIVKPESLRSMEARYEETLRELANAIKDEKAK